MEMSLPPADMNWKLKSAIQRTCARLPGGGESTYYFLQRSFGRMRRRPDSMPNLREASKLIAELRTLGFNLHGKRVMEVGTGRRLDMPLAFYLCGASSVLTYDLHPYLREELVLGAIKTLAANRAEVLELFAPLTDADDLAKRFESLTKATTLEMVLQIAKIVYRAPADAMKTGLADRSIDLQFSYTVFEHIPEAVLEGILIESNRILSSDGVACHHIDPSDHFAHVDGSISFVNFLQFEEEEWKRYNDNQFAYHNRLRVSDYEALYRRVDHRMLKWSTSLNERGMKEIESGALPLASPYKGVPVDVLATCVVRAVSQPKR